MCSNKLEKMNKYIISITDELNLLIKRQRLISCINPKAGKIHIQETLLNYMNTEFGKKRAKTRNKKSKERW